MGIKLQCLYSHIADLAVTVLLLGFCLATLTEMQDRYDVECHAVETSWLFEFEICYLDGCKSLALNSRQQTKTIQFESYVPWSMHFPFLLQHSFSPPL